MNSKTTIYFGKYINDNVLSLDILDDNLLEFLENNYENKGTLKKKVYQYNNLYYEIKNKKQKCFRKNNMKIKEFKKNNIIIKIFNYDLKYLDLDIFPSVKNYLNEEELCITNYGDCFDLVKSKNSKYLILNSYNQDLINQITKILT
jgi:hypothetical protein